jgi:hypothetical protein
MSPYLSENVLGTEDLLDALESAIIRDINDALSVVYERRAEADQVRADLRGVPYVPLEYEDVPANHVYVGNFPSLVLEEVGPEAYPYIAVTTEDYAPEAEDIRLDHESVFRSGFTVHCLAKAEPEDDTVNDGVDESRDEGGYMIDPASDTVFRRAVRMAEAVFLVLNSDPTTSRMIAGSSNPVRGQHSLPWRYQHKGRGLNFWFQAVGTSYAIKSYTSPYGP